jgi:hypothetical protein
MSQIASPHPTHVFTTCNDLNQFDPTLWPICYDPSLIINILKLKKGFKYFTIFFHILFLEEKEFKIKFVQIFYPIWNFTKPFQFII